MAPSSDRSRSRSYSPQDRRRKRSSQDKQENTRNNNTIPENKGERSNVIAIFNLDPRTTNDDLIKIFSEYGSITNSRLVMDQKRGKSRGFAFITYRTEDEADNAKTQGHGKMIDDKEIRVDFSITKKAHDPTPGMYLGHVNKEHLAKVLNRKSPPPPRLKPEEREKSISPDRPPVTHPYKGRSRTKSLSPESLAKRTAKVRNPREERNYGHDNNRKSSRESRDRRRERSRSPQRSRAHHRSPPRRSRYRSRERSNRR